MNLVEKNDLILTTPCAEFDFENPPFNPIDFAQALVGIMYEKNGIGLAANQIGVAYRIFAMRGSPQNFVCYNPRIVSYSDETIYLEEGCLTYPGLVVKIKRPRHIRARFQTPNGEVKTETFTGMTARIFQHELDHLNGIIFYNKANRFHRDKALKRYKNGVKYNLHIKDDKVKELENELT